MRDTMKGTTSTGTSVMSASSASTGSTGSTAMCSMRSVDDLAVRVQAWWVSARQRGLSQSTENAILIAGCVVVAVLIVGVVKTFVEGKLAGLS